MKLYKNAYSEKICIDKNTDNIDKNIDNLSLQSFYNRLIIKINSTYHFYRYQKRRKKIYIIYWPFQRLLKNITRIMVKMPLQNL